jgi:hypothetical protein
VDKQRSAVRWSARDESQAGQIGFRLVLELRRELLAETPAPPDAP